VILRQRAAKQLYATARKALSDLAGRRSGGANCGEFIRRIKMMDEEKSLRYARIRGGRAIK